MFSGLTKRLNMIHQHTLQQENKQHTNKNRINNLNTSARYVLMPK